MMINNTNNSYKIWAGVINLEFQLLFSFLHVSGIQTISTQATQNFVTLTEFVKLNPQTALNLFL